MSENMANIEDEIRPRNIVIDNISASGNVRYRTFVVVNASTQDVIGRITVASDIVVGAVNGQYLSNRAFAIGAAFYRVKKKAKVKEQYKKNVGQLIALNRLKKMTPFIIDMKDDDAKFSYVLKKYALYEYAKIIGQKGVSWMRDGYVEIY